MGKRKRKSARKSLKRATKVIHDTRALWGDAEGDDDDDAYIDSLERTRKTARGGKQLEVFVRGVKRIKTVGTDVPVAGKHAPPCVGRGPHPAQNRQAEVARYLHTHRAVIAAHGVGTGKTLLAVTAGECALANTPSVCKVVVVVPLSLVENFHEALASFRTAHRDNFHVLTYEDLDKAYRPLAVGADGKLRKDLKALRKAVSEEFGDAMVVFDEAHRMRTDLVARAGTRPKGPLIPLYAAAAASRVLLLTATPVVNEPHDLRNLVAMARGDLTPLSRVEFDAVLASPKATKRYFSDVLSFFESDRAGDDYPAVSYVALHLTMTREQQREYERIEAGHASKFDVGDPKAFYTGLRQAVNLPDLGLKADAIARLLAAEPKHRRRAIVFSQFIKNGVKVIIQALKARGLSSVHIVGSMSAAARADAKRRFDDGKAAVMILSEAGATGLSFRGVRHLFLYEPAWNPSTEIQAAGRGDRFRSHAHLPKKERTLVIHRVRVSKDPRRAKTAGHDLSADDLLIELSEAKNATLTAFLARIRRLDIGAGFGGLQGIEVKADKAFCANRIRVKPRSRRKSKRAA